MAINLPHTSGFHIGPEGFDLLAHTGQIKRAADAQTALKEHFISPDKLIPGTIKTIEAAETALKNGDLEVNQFGGLTIVYYVVDGNTTSYIWDAESEVLLKMGRPVGNNFLNMTGANYIEFDNDGSVFNFNVSWFISVQFLTLYPTGAFQTLFSAGDNSFNFLAGAGNYGIYLDDREPVTQGGSSRMNTWVDPATIRVMLNYDHTNRKLEYWYGAMGSNPQKKSLNVDQYQPANDSQLNETPTKLFIGKPMSGTGGFLGEVNEFIGGTQFLGATQVQDIFSGEGVGTSWDNHPEITIRASIGEDTWPAVNVTGSVLTNGTVVGGSSDDFQPVPSVE